VKVVEKAQTSTKLSDCDPSFAPLRVLSEFPRQKSELLVRCARFDKEADRPHELVCRGAVEVCRRRCEEAVAVRPRTRVAPTGGADAAVGTGRSLDGATGRSIARGVCLRIGERRARRTRTA
jgi:hypothetical protein